MRRGPRLPATAAHLCDALALGLTGVVLACTTVPRRYFSTRSSMTFFAAGSVPSSGLPSTRATTQYPRKCPRASQPSWVAALAKTVLGPPASKPVNRPFCAPTAVPSASFACCAPACVARLSSPAVTTNTLSADTRVARTSWVQPAVASTLVGSPTAAGAQSPAWVLSSWYPGGTVGFGNTSASVSGAASTARLLMSRGFGWADAAVPAEPVGPGWVNMMYPPAAHTPASTATARTPTTVTQSGVRLAPAAEPRVRRPDPLAPLRNPGRGSGRSGSGGGPHWLGRGGTGPGRGCGCGEGR